MDVLKDLLSLLAAFPHHLGTILICSGAVLVCSGIIFWRPATDRSQRGQTPLPPRGPARYQPDLGSSDGRERRPMIQETDFKAPALEHDLVFDEADGWYEEHWLPGLAARPELTLSKLVAGYRLARSGA